MDNNLVSFPNFGSRLNVDIKNMLLIQCNRLVKKFRFLTTTEKKRYVLKQYIYNSFHIYLNKTIFRIDNLASIGLTLKRKGSGNFCVESRLHQLYEIGNDNLSTYNRVITTPCHINLKNNSVIITSLSRNVFQNN